MANVNGLLNNRRRQRVHDGDDVFFRHGRDNAKLFSIGQAKKERLSEIPSHGPMCPMNEIENRPYGDIADRLIWHRELEGLTQAEYAEKIGVKRARLSQWEDGINRLSLDGALALRKTFGLSLDFMYEGIDDALPMTLRRAWRDRPRVSRSR